MLYIQTLESLNPKVKVAIDELFAKAEGNQKNENDLLLVLTNGLKKNYSDETLRRMRITPYSIGPDIIGFRYSTFYDFINQYRTKHFDKAEIAKLNKEEKELSENTSIELELLLYLKFWETDLILRRLYNLSRLCRGLDYEWKFNQGFFNNRKKIIREEIQDPIKDICPKFNELLNSIYFRQLRNAIAHTQYYFLYRSINLTNKKENKYNTISSISYEDWEIIFHKNILMYNNLIRCFNEYEEKYKIKAKNEQNRLLITFPEKATNGLNKTGLLKYDFSHKGWYWENQ